MYSEIAAYYATLFAGDASDPDDELVRAARVAGEALRSLG